MRVSDIDRKKYKEKNKLLLSKINILEQTINNDSKYEKLREDLKMTLDEIDIRDNEIKELKKNLYEKDMKLKRNGFIELLQKNEELCNKNKTLENIIKNKDNLLQQFGMEDCKKMGEIEHLTKKLKNSSEKMELSNSLLKLNINENNEMKNRIKLFEFQVNNFSEKNIALKNNFSILSESLLEDIRILETEKEELFNTNSALTNNYGIMSESLSEDILILEKEKEKEKLSEENLALINNSNILSKTLSEDINILESEKDKLLNDKKAILYNYKMISGSVKEDYNTININMINKNNLINKLTESNKHLNKENKSSEIWGEYYKKDYVMDKKIIKNLNLDIINLTNDNIKLNSIKLNNINEIKKFKNIIVQKENKIKDNERIINTYDTVLSEIGTNSYKRECKNKEELKLYKNECESLENEIEKIRISLSKENKLKKKYINLLDDFGYYEISESDINDAKDNA